MAFYLACIFAYLLGSIPSAVLVGKAFFGVDVREHGSLNAGATNTFRVLGKQAGTGVLLMDIIKGATAANLVLLMSQDSLEWTTMTYKIVFGVLAVIGHIYPVFAGFKGGKGIATLLGLVFALDPVMALLCVVIFLVVLLSTNMVSAGSIIATLSFGVIAALRHGEAEPVLQIFAIFAMILVLYTHRANIGRIIKGEEKKIYLFGNNRK